MHELKIGVVEDELIIGHNIVRTLAEIGYRTGEVAVSYSEAVVMLQEEKPDLVLLDINLSGKRDGIDVAAYMNDHMQIPFIFLTANSDTATVERAKKVLPDAYLIKPFTRDELFVAIEMALHNRNSRVASAAQQTSANHPKDSLFIRNRQSFTRVKLDDILVVESNDNYVTIHLANGEKLLHRCTLTEFAALLPASGFYRCHRSFVIRTDAIQQIDEHELRIGNQRIPLGKDRFKELLDILGIAP